MNNLLKKLPDEIIFKISNLVYQMEHSILNKILLKEFESYILEKGNNRDMGSMILARIDGMPLLELH